MSGPHDFYLIRDTVNSIRRQIEADYPQLAAQGIHGWEVFRKVFDQPGSDASPGR